MTSFNSASELTALMDREEPLLPELAPHLQDSVVGKMIHHPLLVSTFFEEGKFAYINECYRRKSRHAQELFDAGKYSSYVWLHERPYRLEAFLRCVHLMPEDKYWKMVRDIWTDTENFWQHRAQWRFIWNDVKHDPTLRRHCMHEDELKALDAMLDTFTVWRGVKLRSAVNGLSWTVDKDKAIWFAKRLRRRRQRSLLVEGEVRKQDVLAYFTGRNESEIVSAKVKFIAITDITESKAKESQ